MPWENIWLVCEGCPKASDRKFCFKSLLICCYCCKKKFHETKKYVIQSKKRDQKLKFLSHRKSLWAKKTRSCLFLHQIQTRYLNKKTLRESSVNVKNRHNLLYRLKSRKIFFLDDRRKAVGRSIAWWVVEKKHGKCNFADKWGNLHWLCH